MSFQLTSDLTEVKQFMAAFIVHPSIVSSQEIIKVSTLIISCFWLKCRVISVRTELESLCFSRTMYDDRLTTVEHFSQRLLYIKDVGE